MIIRNLVIIWFPLSLRYFLLCISHLPLQQAAFYAKNSPRRSAGELIKL
nr:MAG TPA: hypothetical protein [Caudoviricetes sp.]